ncbi:MAG: ABC transporter permease [Chlamydiia bacterium]|nr:ABC transporter permease [Chlamydiia bacterium]
MRSYLIRRLLLIPLTLFCIIFVNFLILGLAPGEPTEVAEVSQTGAATKTASGVDAFGGDFRYLEFRQRYGLTLPIALNTWPWMSLDEVLGKIQMISTQRSEGLEIPFSELTEMKRLFGDQAAFIMPKLLEVMQNKSLSLAERKTALKFFIRGGFRLVHLGPNLSAKKRAENKEISESNLFLLQSLPGDETNIDKTVAEMKTWYASHEAHYGLGTLFFETRFFRYFSRVLTLDFGTLREDPTRTVVGEVVSRFKYSLTLSLTPMLITFALCMLFGFIMALYRGMVADTSLNLIFLVLYAIPIFVAAPFLIEEVALKHGFPISGFTSPDRIYDNMTSAQRLFDIARHIFLPIVAIMYGMLAAQSRLARTAVLEVSRQDFVRTAQAKGLPKMQIWIRYIGRNASVTIVTALAGSLGVILAGSLIVETLFGIDGFGKFFYEAVLNRDYNVIMFSAIAGSLLTLLGYLAADVAYTILDPRVTLE